MSRRKRSFIHKNDELSMFINNNSNVQTMRGKNHDDTKKRNKSVEARFNLMTFLGL